MSLVLYWLPFGVILMFSLFLRLYRLPETITFTDDQGMDLLIIRQMELSGHRPLVGPYLSVDQVYTPPTYYYLTWMLYHLTHSISGIVYGYAAINILTLILLMKLMTDMAGRRAGLITGYLFTVSSLMIEHSRTFWQPYSMQLFLVLCLLSLWHAFQKKSLTLLYIAVLNYVVALSVYPSPMLILPFMMYHLVRWFRNIKSLPIFQSYFYAVGTITLTCIVIFLPQIIFEITNGFPTIQTYAAHPAAAWSFVRAYMKLGQNVIALGNSFLPTAKLFPGSEIYSMVLLLLVFGYLLPRHRFTCAIHAFLAPWTLILGIAMFYFQTNDVYKHHTWAYLPFLFLISGYSINRALDRPVTSRGIAMYFFTIYTALSVWSARGIFSDKMPNNIHQIRAISEFIRMDMSSRGLTQESTKFFHSYFGDVTFASDVVFRVFYWLVESGTITMALTPAGNNLRFDLPSPIERPNMYIICFQLSQLTDAIKQCVEEFAAPSTYVVMNQTKIGNTWVFALLDLQKTKESRNLSLLTTNRRKDSVLRFFASDQKKR